MDNPILSIIIPVYNAERFLCTALESIVSQVADEKLIEIILINDGSTDNSGSIGELYQTKYKFVRQINNDNHGAGYARNCGIKEANGLWILFLDSDDLLIDGSLEESFFMMLKTIEKEYDIVYMSKIDSDYYLENQPKIVFPESVEEIEYHIPNNEFWSCIYKREFLTNNGVFFFEYKKQDVESAFRFRAFSRTDRILVCRNKVLIIHRNNPESNVNTWRLNNLYEIKGLVFYELFQESDQMDLKVKSWLYCQYLYYTKNLLLYGKRNGITEDLRNQIYNLLSMYNTKDARKVSLTVKYRIYCFVLSCLKKRKLLWGTYLLVCGNREQNVVYINHNYRKGVLSDDTSDLMRKSIKYREFVTKNYNITF